MKEPRLSTSDRNRRRVSGSSRSVEECRDGRWTRVLTERRQQKQREYRAMVITAAVGLIALAGLILLVWWWS